MPNTQEAVMAAEAIAATVRELRRTLLILPKENIRGYILQQDQLQLSGAFAAIIDRHFAPLIAQRDELVEALKTLQDRASIQVTELDYAESVLDEIHEIATAALANVEETKTKEV